MLKYIILLSSLGHNWCAIFDFEEVEDPWALLWDSSRAVLGGKTNSECKTNSAIGPDHGVCQNPTFCMISGGKPNGICGILKTCCTYEHSCGEVKNQKISYFQSSSKTFGNRECKYDIHLINSNICQVRLDFEWFNLAPPAQVSDVSRCESDRLQIYPNLYNIPELCGNNDKQHVYIHVNQSTGTKKVTLNMITLSNQSPTWKIKVTQLECPGVRNTNDVIDDFHILAPLGAIQYHTEYSGEIKSFGYDTSRNLNSYTSNMQYAIVFRRLGGVCGVKFQIKYMNLPNPQSSSRDKRCLDNLHIPFLNLYDRAQRTDAKLCSSEYSVGTTFESLSPGPLIIYFESSPTYAKPREDGPKAFYLSYELMTTC